MDEIANGRRKILPIRFNWDLNFGHILTALTFLITIGGGAVASYITVNRNIEQMRYDVMMKIGEHESRITSLEKAQDREAASNAAFQTEMRNDLSKITDLLGDVRERMGTRGTR